MKNFKRIKKPFGVRWLHNLKPVWIVYYRHKKHFIVYKAIARVPKGRDPWSVDNRAINRKDAAKTFKEAMEIANNTII